MDLMGYGLFFDVPSRFTHDVWKHVGPKMETSTGVFFSNHLISSSTFATAQEAWKVASKCHK